VLLEGTVLGQSCSGNDKALPHMEYAALTHPTDG